MKYVGDHARERAHYRDDGHWPPPAPEVPVTDEDIARFRAAYPGVTCSDKVLRILAALHRDHAIRVTGDAR